MRALRLVSIFLAIFGFAAANEATRPNLIFLLTDDQRWDAVGYAGNSAMKTPEIDRLAAEGVVFEKAFVVSSVCAVSRASILLSRYPRSSGIEDFNTPISEDQWPTTYPEVLRNSGYHTGFIGKWGVGALSPKKIEEPASHFDFWSGFPGQGHFFHDASCDWAASKGPRCTCPPVGEQEPWQRSFGADGLENPVHLSTEIIPEHVDRFLEGRDESKPFCLSISFKAPHAPWQDWDPELRNSYNNIELPIADSVDALPPEFMQEHLNFTQGQQLLTSAKRRDEWLRHYYRLVTGVDVALGKIRESLQNHDLNSSTVIVFTSDNGMFFGEHGFTGKWLMYEESIRVPMVIFDPRSPAEDRGKRVSSMVLNLDVAPTLLEFAGAPIPDSMQGLSLLPLLRDPDSKLRDDWFYEHHFTLPAPMQITRSEGVRTDSWKYIRYIDQDPPFEELFDLERDPLELNNLAQTEPARQQLLDLRARWQEATEQLK
ncbi:MAG: arylsulfatase A-like enzyme [Verrucomicrobiales bacterium]|jgi:arylsulfatase A-like enzyme